MLVKNNFKNIIVLKKNENYKMTVKEEITVRELKDTLKRMTGENIDLYYIYYNSINLLSYYDNQPLAKLFANNLQASDHIFYMITSEGKLILFYIKSITLLIQSKIDYKEIIDGNGTINCNEHPMNIGTLSYIPLNIH